MAKGEFYEDVPRMMLMFLKLHMIENRYRLEREIYRGRMYVRQALQMKDKDQSAPDGDQAVVADNESRTREPGSRSSSKGPRLPWISVSSSNQLPVESDPEAGYQARSPKTKPRRSFLLAEGGPTGTSSTTRRRHLSSTLENPSEGEESEPLKQAESRPGTPPSPTQSRLEQTSSYLRHLRNKSFGALSLPFSKSVSRSPREGSSKQNDMGVDDEEEERWSTDTDDEDDDVPWSGAMLSPRLGSRVSLGDVGLGLGLSGDIRRSSTLNSLAQDGLSDDGIDEALLFGRSSRRGVGSSMALGGPSHQEDDDV